ncbi:hypothetical protein HDV00_007958, partial [Rhizophlyctis rosea]
MNGCVVFVGNLAENTLDSDLRNHFGRLGLIEDALVVRMPGNRYCGYVRFASGAKATMAVGCCQNEFINGSQIRVELSKDPEPRRTAQKRILLNNTQPTQSSHTITINADTRGDVQLGSLGSIKAPRVPSHMKFSTIKHLDNLTHGKLSADLTVCPILIVNELPKAKGQTRSLLEGLVRAYKASSKAYIKSAPIPFLPALRNSQAIALLVCVFEEWSGISDLQSPWRLKSLDEFPVPKVDTPITPKATQSAQSEGANNNNDHPFTPIHPLFATLDDVILQDLATSLQFEHYHHGEDIIPQDAISTSMFFLLAGTAQILSPSGAALGEVPSAGKSQQVTSLKLDKEALDKLGRTHRRIGEKIALQCRLNSDFAARAATAVETGFPATMTDIEIVIKHLQSIPLFHHLNETFIHTLSLHTSLQSYQASDIIAQKNTPAHNMFCIIRGAVGILEEPE